MEISSALSISCYLMLGVSRCNFGYSKSDTGAGRIGLITVACAKAQLRMAAAPFDSKSMPFLQEYDSIEITDSMGYWGFKFRRDLRALNRRAREWRMIRARSGVNGPSRDGAHHSHPPLQSVLYVL